MTHNAPVTWETFRLAEAFGRYEKAAKCAAMLAEISTGGARAEWLGHVRRLRPDLDQECKSAALGDFNKLFAALNKPAEEK